MGHLKKELFPFKSRGAVVQIALFALLSTATLSQCKSKESRRSSPLFAMSSEEADVNLSRQENVEPPYIDELRNRLDDIYDDLQRVKLSLFVNQNKEDLLETRISQCAAELAKQNPMGAAKYWEEIQIYLTTHDQAKSIASKLIEKMDLTSKSSVLPMIQFTEYMNVPQAYGSLIFKLNETDHFYGSRESFVLAENIKKACGVEQPVFQSLPQVLRDITSSMVTIQNKWNQGYLYYQSDPDNFFTWFSPHKHRNHYDKMHESRKPRGQWEFILMGDRMKIVNSFNKNVLVDKRTVFSVELASDSEIRLRVVESGKAGIVGKYLVGKARNKGEQFTQIQFTDKDAVLPDQLLWVTQPFEKRAEPAKIQRC